LQSLDGAEPAKISFKTTPIPTDLYLPEPVNSEEILQALNYEKEKVLRKKR
jgi:hypothetical protein